MARFRVKVSKAKLARADVAQISLAFDSVFGRIRDLGLSDPMVYAALARIALQLTYRLASERWIEEGENLVFQVDLADWERSALKKNAVIIINEIERKIQEYKAILESGRARNRSTVEARIDALEIAKEIIAQIVNGKKQFKSLLREGWVSWT